MKKAVLKKRSIGLVGPVAPYSGGIAHYTEQLMQAMGKQTNVVTVSFKRLYPGWLYPGKGVTKVKKAYKTKGVSYLIDAYSLPSLHRAVNLFVESGCQVVVFSWWTLIWQPAIAYMSWLLRRRGIKTIFLCHNVNDHKIKGPRGLLTAIVRPIARLLIRQADGYVVHSLQQQKLLRSIVGEALILKRLHPVYDRFPRPTKKLAKRGRLELLAYGFIRPYKGLEYLIEALNKLQDERIFTTIAGEVWDDPGALKKRLIASGAPNLDLWLRYISDQDTASLFSRADVLVAPYTSATGSGPATIAYNYGVPVLASQVGGLAEAVVNGKTGWLVKPRSADELAQAIAGIDRGSLNRMKPYIKEFCSQNSWRNMAKELIKLAANL